MTTDSRDTPVVALDIDGVIRVLNDRPDAVGDLRVVTVTESDVFTSRFHRGPEAGAHEVLLARGAGAWINSLLDRGVEVVWATTWEHTANRHFAPLLNIPELPVAVVSASDESASLRGGAPVWKAHQLAQRFRGRPLVWVDDDLPTLERTWERLEEIRMRTRDTAPTLTVSTLAWEGLTEEHMAEVDEGLTLALTAEGRQELHAERERELRRLRDQARRESRRRERHLALQEDAVLVGRVAEREHLGMDEAAYAALLQEQGSDDGAWAHYAARELIELAQAAPSNSQRRALGVVAAAAIERARAVSIGADAGWVTDDTLGRLSEVPLRSLRAARQRLERRQRSHAAWWRAQANEIWRGAWAALWRKESEADLDLP